MLAMGFAVPGLFPFGSIVLFSGITDILTKCSPYAGMLLTITEKSSTLESIRTKTSAARGYTQRVYAFCTHTHLDV